jgi:hypothetical protein
MDRRMRETVQNMVHRQQAPCDEVTKTCVADDRLSTSPCLRPESSKPRSPVEQRPLGSTGKAGHFSVGTTI